MSVQGTVPPSPTVIGQGMTAGGTKSLQFGLHDIPHHPGTDREVLVQKQIPQTHDLPPVCLRHGTLDLGRQAARGLTDDFEVSDDGIHRSLIGGEPGVIHALHVVLNSIDRLQNVVQVEAKVPSRMLKNPVLPRVLQKVQAPGGA